MSNAAIALRFSEDGKIIVCSNAGDNSVGIFERNEETVLLKQRTVLPSSGTHPKQKQLPKFPMHEPVQPGRGDLPPLPAAPSIQS